MFCSGGGSPAQHYLKDIYYLEDVGGLEQSKISEVSNESRKKPGMKICFPKCDLQGSFFDVFSPSKISLSVVAEHCNVSKSYHSSFSFCVNSNFHELCFIVRFGIF